MVFFKSEAIEVRLPVGDHDQIYFLTLVTDLRRCLFVELRQFGPRAGYSDFYFAIVRIRPAVAMPLPPSVPPDLRILERAMWPQITAGKPAAATVAFRLPSRSCNKVR